MQIRFALAFASLAASSIPPLEAADFELYSFPSLPPVLDANGVPVLVPVTKYSSS